MSGPLKSLMNIRRDELPFSLLMFGYFFLIITTFWILKPLKKGLFIGFYKESGGVDLFSWFLLGSQAELLAKVLNMVIAFFAVILFTWLARKFRRQQLTYIFSILIVACLVAFSFVISNPGDLTVWSFYLFGDLFNTLMVATFFAFLNDSVNASSAKRLYGLVVLGGVTGGVFGTQFVRIWIDDLTMISWLWICLLGTVLIAVISGIAGRLVPQDNLESIQQPNQNKDTGSKSNAAIEGAKLVFKSKYLLAIVGIVGFYEIISTIMDFQFTATIEHYLSTEDAISQHFATIFSITNIVALTVQLFLTSFIMTRLGLTVALLVLPCVIMLGSFSFLAFPILWVGSFLNTADNAFNYSINQSAKEALYVPTSRDEKYKAKAFIDMFVYRFSKALAVGVSLIITTLFRDFSTIRWLSFITILIVVVWIIVVRFAGNKFNDMTSDNKND
ncbi:hypothetical protein GF337_06820 [candidate division KSB1 bacterium]|nr:hypothetical protein [candidate division KSB1 bacterium]